AFLQFQGIDAMSASAGPQGVLQALSELVGAVQDAADEFGVAFLASDIDRDGGKLILVAGAPTTGGDDADRMLRAVRRIADTPLPVPVRIGVSTGSVVAG